MLGSVHALEFVKRDQRQVDLPCIVALYGDEPFLKSQILAAIQQQLSEADDPAPVWDASGIDWADVSDMLLTPSLFGSGNTCLVLRQADSFVSSFRTRLEAFVDSSPTGVTLILELRSWPGNTKLAKKCAKSGLAIACSVPVQKAGKRAVVDRKRMLQWITDHGADVHAIRLTKPQSEQVLDLIGENLGLIDGELAKLALFADPKGQLTDAQITEVVGSWRAQTTWDLLDSICNGDAKTALEELDRFLQSGERPQALFGAFSWSLRRFAAAVRIVEMEEAEGRPCSLPNALAATGVPQYQRSQFEKTVSQLKRIGRRRAQNLYPCLLNADLKLKRSHASVPRGRLVLEELIFQLSDPFRNLKTTRSQKSDRSTESIV